GDERPFMAKALATESLRSALSNDQSDLLSGGLYEASAPRKRFASRTACHPLNPTNSAESPQCAAKCGSNYRRRARSLRRRSTRRIGDSPLCVPRRGNEGEVELSGRLCFPRAADRRICCHGSSLGIQDARTAGGANSFIRNRNTRLVVGTGPSYANRDGDWAGADGRHHHD